MKTFLLAAIVPLALLMVSSVQAEDNLLAEVSSLSATDITDAQIEIEDGSLDGLDVDALANDADGEGTDAIEACFRRFGYGGYGYHCYRPCYRPCYTYTYHSFYCYRPVYHYCAPVYHRFWGCY